MLTGLAGQGTAKRAGADLARRMGGLAVVRGAVGTRALAATFGAASGAVAGLVAITPAAGFVLPYSTKMVLDEVLPNRDIQLLGYIALAGLAATIVQSVTGYALSQVVSVAAQQAIADIFRAVGVEAAGATPARWGGLEPGYLGPLVGKTGTTDSEHDLWFIGATPKYAAALWIGYDQPTPLGFSASDFAAPMWGWWMHRATQFDKTFQHGLQLGAGQL